MTIGSFLFYAPSIFSKDKSPFIPIAMLLFLVFSVAFIGTLVFGRPLLWYLDGKKQEAFSLLGLTLGIILAITIFALITLYFVR